MSAMRNSSLYNLSGRAIPENVSIAIVGEPAPGDVLVIESFDGTGGRAAWRSEAELKARQDATASKSAAQSSWPPPLKQRAPYS
jgi:hypothetical protein